MSVSTHTVAFVSYDNETYKKHAKVLKACNEAGIGKLSWKTKIENGVFDCLSCGEPMVLKETFTTGNYKGYKKYRVRRYYCNICDEQRTIFADGFIDEIITPESAVKEAKKLNKQNG